jgi:hypothetical protein
MTWAEITAWNKGRWIQRAGLLLPVWLRMLPASAPMVLSADEMEARERLGHARFELWVRSGHADAQAEQAKA